jgi:hypothetical protein
MSSGSSSWFVTCAWLLGVRRARILAIAICISTGVSSAMTLASLAGVVPPISRTTSARDTLMSTVIRASAWSSSAIASTATSRSKP